MLSPDGLSRRPRPRSDPDLPRSQQPRRPPCRRIKHEYGSLLLAPEIRSCRVSYQDSDGIRRSVEVTAETLYESAVLGIKALELANWSSAPIMIDVTVKAPETTHTIKTTALSSWLSGHGGVLANRCSKYGCAICSVSSFHQRAGKD